MGMNTLTTDNSLWMKFTENILEGISGVYVDDVVQDGTAEFGRLTNQLSVNYNAKANIYGDIRIADIEFQRDKYGIRVNQSQYLRSLRPLPTDASYKDFRSARMKLMWLVHSKPDVAYCAASAAQITAEQWPFATGAIRRFNATIQRLLNAPEESMRFPMLDQDTLRIYVYCDASFTNNEDMSSQMGYIDFLTDGKTDAHRWRTSKVSTSG
jgi:hypothetical protein